MILKWTAAWYEEDQTVIVGEKGWFSLPKDDNSCFYTGGSFPDREKWQKMEIIRITHSVLGDVKGIVTIGLDYTIYLMNGTILEVNAEEHPGEIYDSPLVINDWTFDVEVKLLDNTEDAESTEHNSRKKRKAFADQCKALLGISEAPWERYI